MMEAPAAVDASYAFDGDVLHADVVTPQVATPGVTVGGAKDVDYLRARIEAGEVPPLAAIRVSGLFSEHDLPPPPQWQACTQRICVRGQAVEATLPTHPAVHFAVHLGFGSNLDLAGLTRPRLNLVAVLDLSGSMGGEPARTAVAAARALAAQLGPEDRLSLIAFDHEPRVLMPPTRSPDPRVVEAALYDLGVSGGSALERALYAGFEFARRSAARLPSAVSSRVVLITDAVPNVGRIGPGTFVGLTESFAARGLSLTILGVGARFGAQLAYGMAAIRGGNAFFLRSPEHAREKIEEELDTMVTELARGLSVRIQPQPGLRVVEIYGVPDALVHRDGDAVRFDVATLFLDRRRGAIVATLAPKGRPNLGRHRGDARSQGAAQSPAHPGSYRGFPAFDRGTL
jgi:Ca-activated chloride channel family protein